MLDKSNKHKFLDNLLAKKTPQQLSLEVYMSELCPSILSVITYLYNVGELRLGAGFQSRSQQLSISQKNYNFILFIPRVLKQEGSFKMYYSSTHFLVMFVSIRRHYNKEAIDSIHYYTETINLIAFHFYLLLDFKIFQSIGGIFFMLYIFIS